MKTSVLTGALGFILTKGAYACSVCFFGDPTEQANIALRQGILALLLILALVLGLFIKFFLSVAKRSRSQNIEG